MATPSNSISLWTARIVSVVFHPIWLPLLFVCVRHWADPSLPRLFVVLALCVVVFPGTVAMLWMWMRRETNWYAMAQANRLVPMVACLIGLAFFAVANGGLLPERLFQGQLMAIMILLVFISILVNLFWKISVHMMGWGAVAGMAIPFAMGSGSFPWEFVVLAIAFLVGWARIKVESHDLAQVVAGFAAGAAVGGTVYYAFL